MDGSASIFERMRLNRRKLRRYTVEEILRLAQFGNVLIRGWGAATLLQNMPQVVSVRVCAPVEHRVRVVMERIGGEDADTVRQEIERYEASRRRAMRALFDVEEEDPRLYHLVLNTERLSIEACVKAVCELAESPCFQKGAATRAVADKLLETRISTALTEDEQEPRLQ
jgi:cytidylate kinase